MDASGYLVFVFIIIVASICQNLTGFAFGLILITLTGALNILPVSLASNVAMILSLVNATLYLRAHPRQPDWQLLRPILAVTITSLVCGIALLSWMSAGAKHDLGILLGIVVIGSSLLLVIQSRPRKTMSSPLAHGGISVLAGLMGGLFATPGPPIAYHLYRQPLAPEVIRQSLFIIFSSSMLLRLGIVIGTGKFQIEALKLVALAIPVIATVTYLIARFPPNIPQKMIRWLVAGLMAGSGIMLLTAALRN